MSRLSPRPPSGGSLVHRSLWFPTPAGATTTMRLVAKRYPPYEGGAALGKAPVFMWWWLTIRKNPKRDGLGTISTLGAQDSFRRCRRTGELSRRQQAAVRSVKSERGFELTLRRAGSIGSSLRFYHSPRSELTPAGTLRLH